jgi:hypothetical protein
MSLGMASTSTFPVRSTATQSDNARPSGANAKPLAFFAQKKLENFEKRWLALLKYSFATPKKFLRRTALQSNQSPPA